MFVSKKKYDWLQRRLTETERQRDEYLGNAVKKTGEIHQLTGRIFEAENNLRAKVAECERLQEELTSVKEKYTAEVQKNFELVEMLAAECMDHKSLTNFERIKAMTVEEMTKVIAGRIWYFMCDCDSSQQLKCERFGQKPAGGCKECVDEDVKYWLESEVQEDESTN